jgi:hypothetical protein
MAEDTQVIECGDCGRLHQVGADKAGKSISCDCGKTLEVALIGALEGADGASGQAGGAAGSEVPASVGGRLLRHWRALGIGLAVIVAAVVGFSFWYGPHRTMATLPVGDGNRSSKARIENPEVYLAILEDNNRSDEHQNAAQVLLRLRDPVIVPRLCKMAARKDLAARPIVAELLGKKGDEAALAVLSNMLNEEDKTLVFLAAGAIAQIGSPLSESILLELIRMPSRGREILAPIAAAKNDVSVEILEAALDDPALRGGAMDEIAASRQGRCVEALSELARNRQVIEADRLKGIETLGSLNTPEARRALLRLAQDGRVGWKARQVLDQITGP